MHYVSTRGRAEALDFEGATLAGLASDGGLYLPERWPHFSPADFAAMRGLSYVETAVRVIAPFVGDNLSEDELRNLCTQAYGRFAHAAVTPLVQLDHTHWLLELFHGPTLAFKDVALQLLGLLFEKFLSRRDTHITIVGATSGDTGSAAIDAVAGRENIDIFMLHPAGRVSDVQRRQMTTVRAPNVHNIAVEGSFDDAQALVKRMFNDADFASRFDLSAVNSINWARLVAQVVYYVYAGVRLGAPEHPVAFAVPTGNFGDVFAGYVAARMGLPIARLIVATNVNDILHRALSQGDYSQGVVVPTATPSMDIQVSSNFERLLFEASRRDASAVRAAMGSLGQSGRFAIGSSALTSIREHFAAGRADEEETAATMRVVRKETGYLADPHTAVALAVAEKEAHDPSVPMIVLSTAHPAKFPDAVEAACGVHPALPDWLAHLPSRPERITVLPAEQAAVEQFVARVSRAAQEGVVA